MKIKLFENFEEIDLEISYELYDVDKNGDESPISFIDGDEYNFNPFSLVDTIKLFQKYEKKYPRLRIKKITSQILTIEDAKREITGNKYNL